MAFKGQGGYDPLLVTKLVKNYRSHGSIIKIPSKLFYDDELQVKAPRSLRKRFLKLPFLSNKKEPIVFHGVRGENLQEEDSPSWFNAVEALQVVFYLRDLIQNRVDPEEIGIIAPYRKQVIKLNLMAGHCFNTLNFSKAEKIRALMISFGLEPVKIGSVEEFQGQERPVIILTTVR